MHLTEGKLYRRLFIFSTKVSDTLGKYCTRKIMKTIIGFNKILRIYQLNVGGKELGDCMESH